LVAKGHDDFCEEVVLQLSIERLMISIGEACSKLSPEFQEAHPQISWRDIVSMRNLLIHAYHRIDRNQVWKTANQDVPNLVREISKD
jgi:uncharacterized protein with HEPN domain